MAILFGFTALVWLSYLLTFYASYWTGLFQEYSFWLVISEILEQCLFIVDPVVYIAMSIEMRQAILRTIFYRHQNRNRQIPDQNTRSSSM